MKKRRIVFLLIVLILLSLLIKTGAYYLFVSLVIIVSLLGVSGILMLVKGNSIQLSFQQNRELHLVIQTAKNLPLGKINATVEILNPFYNTSEKFPLELMLGQKESNALLPFDHHRMGNLQIKVQTTERVDLFSLFSIPFQRELHTNVLIVPDACAQAGNAVLFQSALNECSHHDYEIREFRDGDSIRDIHYKMSFKMNKYLVKEYLKNNGNSIRVYLDLSDEYCEDVFRAFLSFAQYLVSSRVFSEIYWLSGHQLMNHPLMTQDDYNHLIQTILSYPKARGTQDVSVDLIYSSKGLTLKGGGNRG